MAHNFSHDGQQQPDLDQCLTRLAFILKTLGVQELTIEKDYEFHLIDTTLDLDGELLQTFCRQINQMRDSITAK